MSDNEFSIPFERAFKRLRVDGGDLPADDASDGEGCSKRDQLLTQPNSSALTSNDVPCTSSSSFSSSEMWRPVDQPAPAFVERPPVSEEVPSVSSFLGYHQSKSASDQPKASDCQLRPTMDNRFQMQRFKLTESQRSADNALNKPTIEQLFAKPIKCDSLPLSDLKRTKPKSSSSSELTQNCSNQARNEPDINVNELAAYLDCQLFLPKKMSFMASLAYS